MNVTTKRNKINLLHLIFIIYFILILTILLVIRNYIFNINTQKNIGNSIFHTKEFTITARELVIPSESELRALEDTYVKISSSFSNIIELSIQIKESYKDVKNAPTCSKAHKCFNVLNDYYSTYQEQITKIQKQMASFEKDYIYSYNLVSEIPEFSVLHNEYDKFMQRFASKYKFITSKSKSFSKDKKEIDAIFVESKQIVDELFEEYFDLMCHIVYAEAGIPICTTMERYYVAKVIENRIESSRFPDTIYDIVYQSGQYEPVMTGTIDNNPSQEVIDEVREYLLGNVEIDMPDYVFFQSRSKVTPRVWKEMPSGHFFCY